MLIKKLIFSLASASICISMLAAGKITITDSKLIPVKTTYRNEQSAEMEKLIAPYKQKLDSSLSEVIGFTSGEIKSYAPESPLSNFCADALLHYAQSHQKQEVDIAILNFGGLRKNLPKGIICVRNIFELMPFENEAVIVELKGYQLQEALNYIAAKGGTPIAGARLQIKDKKILEASINNKALDPQKTYRIITSDYLAEGNDKLLPQSSTKKIALNIKIRDIFMEEIKLISNNHKTIEANTDERIIIQK